MQHHIAANIAVGTISMAGSEAPEAGRGLGEAGGWPIAALLSSLFYVLQKEAKAKS